MLCVSFLRRFSYKITAKEFEQLFNVSNAYPVLKRAGAKLMHSFITLEKPELFETWQIAICSVTKYNHKCGSLTVEFNDKIMPYLIQVKQKFVLYNLKEVANFGSLYTTRFYELIQEFKDTGVIVKSIDQLREIFVTGKKFAQYTDFRKRTFAHACQEINDNYDISLKFKEIKNGRKVMAISFTFNKMFVRKTINPKTGNEFNVYIKPKLKTYL